MSNDDRSAQAVPAVGSPVDRGVGPLVERLANLSAHFVDDYGRELDAVVAQRVLRWCSDKAEPVGVSASEDGAIYVRWRQGNQSLSVRFDPNGKTVWAGKIGDRRPYGDGYPPESEWPCLRPNVRADAHHAASTTGENR